MIRRCVVLLRSKMAAVSDGSEEPSADCIDYDLQKQLKGLNAATPDLSTLAQKGDEKVRENLFSSTAGK